MLQRLRNSFSSMTQMARRQEQAANNLANAQTVGYKRERVFVEALDEALDYEGSPISVRQANPWADHTQGALEHTGNPLDLALRGDGFFAVVDEAAGQTRYTRDGRFTLDAEGVLRTTAGHLVEGEDGPLQVPPTAGPIEVTQDGEVRAGNQTIGRLRLVRFEDPTALTRIDGASFDAAGQAPDALTDAMVQQGSLETSNVDVLQEMTQMITHHRLFESQQRSLTTTDGILGNVTRELGRF